MSVLSAASHTSSRSLPIFIFFAALMIALGIFFRFYRVAERPLWDDEVVTWMHVLGISEREVVSGAADFHHVADLRAVLHPKSALRPIFAVIETVRTEDPQHPPIYYLVAHAWVSLFGNSVLALRTLSAIIGVLAIPCMYWLSIELFGSAAAGWAGAALIATAPVAVLYSQEAREYSLWLVSILVSSALFIRALRSCSRGAWGAYSSSLGLSLYVFPLSAFVAAAHAIVALCAHTSSRNRLYAFGSIAVGFLLFAPWSYVILTKLTDINASMSVIVDASSARFQTLWTAVNLIRLDVVDFNGGHRLFVLLATIPIIALIVVAVYDIRQMKAQASRIFVWALLGCTALPLLILDLLFGGHRTATTRYSIPLFIGIDLALAALIASKLLGENRPRARGIWAGVIGLMFVSRIASCMLSTTASTWWNSYNIRTREVAAQINESRRPLILSDDYIEWSLMLSEYLDPNIEVALRPRCYLCKLEKPASFAPADFADGKGARDVFLIAPSEQLRAIIPAQWDASRIGVNVNCINIRGSCLGGIELWHLGT